MSGETLHKGQINHTAENREMEVISHLCFTCWMFLTSTTESNVLTYFNKLMDQNVFPLVWLSLHLFIEQRGFGGVQAFVQELRGRLICF